MRDLSFYQEKAAFVLRALKRLGADQARIYISHGESRDLSLRLGSKENWEVGEDVSLSLSVFKAGRLGHVEISDWRTQSLLQAAQTALQIAKYSAEDACYGLPDAQFYASNALSFERLALDGDDDCGILEMEAWLTKAESSALARDQRISGSDGAGFSFARRAFYLQDSNGFAGFLRRTVRSASVAVIASNDKRQCAGRAWDVACGNASLKAPDCLGEKAAEKALAGLEIAPIVSGTYPVIFSKRAAAALWRFFIQAISGQAQYRALSFLTGKCGDMVLPKHLTVVERPFLSAALASSLFDTEGVATSETAIVENGCLMRYVLDVYSARRLCLPPTGNAGASVHNLSFYSKESTSLAQLIASIDQGFLVHSLMGQGANVLTGDYSHGASGFYISGGKLAYPVEGITLAGNLREMLQGIVALGDEVEYRSAIRTPALLIDKMTVAQ